MAIQLKLGNQHYASTRPTYIGRPVEAIQQTNAILNNRYVANKAAYQSNIDALNNLDVEDQNKEIVQDQADSTENLFKDTINNNQFEFADNVVSTATNEIKSNDELKYAVMSKASKNQSFKELDETVTNGDLDAVTSNRLKAYANNTNYKRLTIDKDGTVHNSFSMPTVVKDPKLGKQITDMTANLKASSRPITFKDGKTLSYAGGAWRMSGQEESIDEVQATQAISQFLQQEPQNIAYFAQQQRLDDVDMLVRNEDNTFVLDDKGNPVKDIQQVNQRDKLKQIGIDDEVLKHYLDSKGGQDMLGGIKLSNYPIERQNELLNQIYNNQYMGSKIRNQVSPGVAAVDYDKVEYKYQADPLMLAQIKRRWKKEDDDAARVQEIQRQFRHTEENVETTNYPKDFSDLQSKVSDSNSNYEAAKKQTLSSLRQLNYDFNADAGIQEKADAKGNIQLGVLDKRGNFISLKKLQKSDPNKILNDAVLGNINDAYKTKSGYASQQRAFLGDLTPEQYQSALNTEKGVFRYALSPGNPLLSAFSTISSDEKKRLEQLGLVSYNSGKVGGGTGGAGVAISTTINDLEGLKRELNKTEEGRKVVLKLQKEAVDSDPNLRAIKERADVFFKDQAEQANKKVVVTDFKSGSDNAFAASNQFSSNFDAALDMENGNSAEATGMYTYDDVQTSVANGKGVYGNFYENGKRYITFKGQLPIMEDGKKTGKTKLVNIKLPAQEKQVWDYGMDTEMPNEQRYHGISAQTAAFSDKGYLYNDIKVTGYSYRGDDGTQHAYSPHVKNIMVDAKGRVLSEEDYGSKYAGNGATYYEYKNYDPNTGNYYTFYTKNLRDVDDYIYSLSEEFKNKHEGGASYIKKEIIKPASFVEVRNNKIQGY